MIILRLIRWACRCRDLPTGDYKGTRPATLREAITGVSTT